MEEDLGKIQFGNILFSFMFYIMYINCELNKQVWQMKFSQHLGRTNKCGVNWLSYIWHIWEIKKHMVKSSF